MKYRLGTLTSAVLVIATIAGASYLWFRTRSTLRSKIVAWTGRWGFKRWSAVDDTSSSVHYLVSGGRRGGKRLDFGPKIPPASSCTKGLTIELLRDAMSQVQVTAQRDLATYHPEVTWVHRKFLEKESVPDAEGSGPVTFVKTADTE